MLVSVDEFRVLNGHSYVGRRWLLIERQKVYNSYGVYMRRLEYIFTPEDLVMFKLVSENIFAMWDTDLTRDIGLNDEFKLMESVYIRLHDPIPRLTG